MRRTFATVLSSLAMGLALCSGAVEQARSAAAPKYVATLVGDPGAQATGLGLNNHGQVVGHVASLEGASQGQAFIWDSHGGMRGLGTLGGIGSTAYDINDHGQVVGVYELNAGRPQAFIHDHAGMRPLSIPGAYSSSALGINAKGHVTGGVTFNDGLRGPYIHDGSEMRVIGNARCCLGGSAINDQGDMAVNDTQPGPFDLPLLQAFAYRNGQLIELGTLSGGSNSVAADINNSGQVVGWSNADNDLFDTRGFVWDERSGMVDLSSFADGAITTSANAINEHGEVVGALRNHRPSSYSAYLYSDGVVIDLQTRLDPRTGANWVLNDARAINDRGQIVVSAFDALTFDSATLLLTPVPEPQTVALLFAGLGVVLMRVRRRAV
jgi:probable HAF family extracellular repeat protein